jgi:hypothetical protein
MHMKNTTRDLDALVELLDGPVSILLDAKPMTPSQLDKRIRRTFNTILSELSLLRIELETDQRRRADQLLYWASLPKSDHVNVIKPGPIVAHRRKEIADKRLDFVQSMFSEVLQLYESRLKTKWQPTRNGK